MAETRVFVTHGHPDLPDDEYGLVESYCTDATCSCRRVMLDVFGRHQEAVLASVNFGFDRGHELAGPFLDPLNPQSQYADVLLGLVAEQLGDPAYVTRLQAHYYQVKGAMADPAYHAQHAATRAVRSPNTRPPLSRLRIDKRKRRGR